MGAKDRGRHVGESRLISVVIVAQLAERLSVEQVVAGSIPVGHPDPLLPGSHAEQNG